MKSHSVERHCRYCGSAFHGSNQEVYCSADCGLADRNAQDLDRPRREPPVVPEEYLTARHVARRLHVDPKEIIRLADSGELPGIKIGDSWRFSPTAVDKWLMSYQLADDLPHTARTSFAEIDATVRRLDDLSTRLDQSASHAIDALQQLSVEAGNPELIGRVSASNTGIDFTFDHPVTLSQLEDAYIAYVLNRCERNKTVTAQVLGIDPSTLYRKLASQGLR